MRSGEGGDMRRGEGGEMRRGEGGEMRRGEVFPLPAPPYSPHKHTEGSVNKHVVSTTIQQGSVF